MLATPVFFYAAELAQDGYDWEGLFTVIVIAAGPATLLGYVAGGRLSDRIGRRPVLIASSLVMVLGVALVFTEQRWLFAPGFFLLTGADAGLASVRPAYLSELFPTEVRATLLSFIFGVVVAAGSLGLVFVGLLDGTWTTRTLHLRDERRDARRADGGPRAPRDRRGRRHPRGATDAELKEQERRRP